MDSSFFWISKLFWLFFSPDTLLVFLLAVSLVLLWMKRYKSAKRLLGVLTLLILIISFFPVGQWLCYPLERQFLPPKKLPASIDGIIVLGGAESIYKSILWQQVELNGSSERYFAFIHLIKKYPHAKPVFTGGTGSLSLQEYKGAHVAKQLFKEQGLDISRIIFEDQSRNTYENAILTHRLINPHPDEKWILITSASHMPRSMGVFTRAGWSIIPFPVDHNTLASRVFRVTLNFSGNLDQLKWALREWIGLTAYYITGKTGFFLSPSDP